jgi:hypothetical protein
MSAYQAIGPDRPLGDREGAEDNFTPERIEEISNEEVKNPADEATGPDDGKRQKRGNRGPNEQPGYGQGAAEQGKEVPGANHEGYAEADLVDPDDRIVLH